MKRLAPLLLAGCLGWDTLEKQARCNAGIDVCVDGGSAGGTAGGTSGGTAGGTSGGTAGGTSGGTAGGTSGGTAGGTSGGTAGGTSGGTAGGTSGGTAGGTAGGTSGGAAGGAAGGTVCPPRMQDCNGLSGDGCETPEACPFGAGSAAWFLAVNAQDVFWTSNIAGTVSKRARAGGATVTIASSQNQPGPIAVNATHVFWVNYAGGATGSGSVHRAQLDGSNPVALASGESAPYGIALDSTKVYWSSNTMGHVKSAPLNGGAPATVVTGLRPGSLAIDGTTLYWVENQGTSSDAVKAINLSNMMQRVVAYNVSYPTGLVVDETHVYFTRDFAGTIHRVAKDAGPADGGESVIVISQNHPVGLTASATELFWTNNASNQPDAGRVMRAFKDGGSVRIFADAQSGPRDIVAIDNFVYWANELGNSVVWGAQ